MPEKRKKGPKQVTVHGVTYKRSSGVDTEMIQRYQQKIEKEIRQTALLERIVKAQSALGAWAQKG